MGAVSARGGVGSDGSSRGHPGSVTPSAPSSGGTSPIIQPSVTQTTGASSTIQSGIIPTTGGYAPGVLERAQQQAASMGSGQLSTTSGGLHVGNPNLPFGGVVSSPYASQRDIQQRAIQKALDANVNAARTSVYGVAPVAGVNVIDVTRSNDPMSQSIRAEMARGTAPMASGIIAIGSAGSLMYPKDIEAEQKRQAQEYNDNIKAMAKGGFIDQETYQRLQNIRDPVLVRQLAQGLLQDRAAQQTSTINEAIKVNMGMPSSSTGGTKPVETQAPTGFFSGFNRDVVKARAAKIAADEAARKASGKQNQLVPLTEGALDVGDAILNQLIRGPHGTKIAIAAETPTIGGITPTELKPTAVSTLTPAEKVLQAALAAPAAPPIKLTGTETFTILDKNVYDKTKPEIEKINTNIDSINTKIDNLDNNVGAQLEKDRVLVQASNSQVVVDQFKNRIDKYNTDREALIKEREGLFDSKEKIYTDLVKSNVLTTENVALKDIMNKMARDDVQRDADIITLSTPIVGKSASEWYDRLSRGTITASPIDLGKALYRNLTTKQGGDTLLKQEAEAIVKRYPEQEAFRRAQMTDEIQALWKAGKPLRAIGHSVIGTFESLEPAATSASAEAMRYGINTGNEKLDSAFNYVKNIAPSIMVTHEAAARAQERKAAASQRQGDLAASTLYGFGAGTTRFLNPVSLIKWEVAVKGLGPIFDRTGTAIGRAIPELTTPAAKFAMRATPLVPAGVGVYHRAQAMEALKRGDTEKAKELLEKSAFDFGITGAMLTGARSGSFMGNPLQAMIGGFGAYEASKAAETVAGIRMAPDIKGPEAFEYMPGASLGFDAAELGARGGSAAALTAFGLMDAGLERGRKNFPTSMEIGAMKQVGRVITGSEPVSNLFQRGVKPSGPVSRFGSEYYPKPSIKQRIARGWEGFTEPLNVKVERPGDVNKGKETKGKERKTPETESPTRIDEMKGRREKTEDIVSSAIGRTAKEPGRKGGRTATEQAVTTTTQKVSESGGIIQRAIDAIKSRLTTSETTGTTTGKTEPVIPSPPTPPGPTIMERLGGGIDRFASIITGVPVGTRGMVIEGVAGRPLASDTSGAGQSRMEETMRRFERDRAKDEAQRLRDKEEREEDKGIVRESEETIRKRKQQIKKQIEEEARRRGEKLTEKEKEARTEKRLEKDKETREARKEQDDVKKREEERKKREEERKKREEERKKREEERKKREEEERKKREEEERKRREEERNKREEERRAKEEKKRDEERKREEERKRNEDEAKRREDLAKEKGGVGLPVEAAAAVAAAAAGWPGLGSLGGGGGGGGMIGGTPASGEAVRAIRLFQLKGPKIRKTKAEKAAEAVAEAETPLAQMSAVPGMKPQTQAAPSGMRQVTFFSGKTKSGMPIAQAQGGAAQTINANTFKGFNINTGNAFGSGGMDVQGMMGGTNLGAVSGMSSLKGMSGAMGGTPNIAGMMGTRRATTQRTPGVDMSALMGTRTPIAPKMNIAGIMNAGRPQARAPTTNMSGMMKAGRPQARAPIMNISGMMNAGRAQTRVPSMNMKGIGMQRVPQMNMGGMFRQTTTQKTTMPKFNAPSRSVVNQFKQNYVKGPSIVNPRRVDKRTGVQKMIGRMTSKKQRKFTMS